MGKLLSIIVSTIGVLGAIAFIILDIIIGFVNIFVCCGIALAVVLILVMCSLLIGMLSRIDGELSRLAHNRNNKDE